ncbi:ABC transporter permease [Nitratireductor kimnyeongensis]|uniref:ABC transporter permease n=1 Tax=Nitratireductor kimnyeongensis TaxID=430679 RepID=A0ABW0TAL3_9HYPH|nr:ABC transporter permease [Nitratireductor kimnyeongensis]QZZ35871.1 ABC transporter permease [Nitratireductor kimnyeongensis]
MLLESVHLALLSIARNKMRSLLTLLGVIIGVAAVISLLTIGGGARERIRSEMAGLGSRLIFVFAGVPPDPSVPAGVKARALTNMHLINLERSVSEYAIVAGYAETPLRISYGARGLPGRLLGVSRAYFALREWPLRRGRLPTPLELASNASICVVGSKVSEALFGIENPVGARIRLGPSHCRVVGELSDRGASFSGDQDTIVMMPLGLFQTRISGKNEVDQILINAPNEASIPGLKTKVAEEMRPLRRIVPGQNDDFQVEDMAEYMRQASSIIGNVTAILGAIAAISLLVGGIGIMNIMLVSVTERTREIGIRMAIGARQRDILVQFLTEASVLSLLGGLIGIGTGLAIAWAVTAFMNVDFVPSLAAIAAIAAVSMLIGIVFGFFPALRGARLDPIEALRHE